jgi:class 3 adenylate cyclase
MRCPHCQQENREGARFCAACGSSIAWKCPACGSQPPPGAAFCDHCGTPLTATTTAATPPSLAPRPQTLQAYTPAHLAEKILTSKAALEGERKQVTVLFANLKGSMELLADRDPEEARQLLDPVLERMMAAVHQYEGTVNRVMGDRIMALFGAPIAHEDPAVRACYAALAMQASVQQYASETQRTRGVPIHIRVGLNAGEGVVRSIGSDLHMDYTAIGHTTHLAARMEQMALPGSIMITSEVLRLAEGYVQVQSLGQVAVKWLSAPVEVSELIGAGPVRSRLQAAAIRGHTRFVGRHRELDHLSQALEWAGSGRAQLVAPLDVPVDEADWPRLDPPQRRQRTLEALTWLLLLASQRQPLLVIVEDLHWLDAETQACLDRLVESLPTARLLLLVNYRPEYQQRWGGKTCYAQLRLDPLPSDGIGEGVHSLPLSYV